MSIFSRIKRAIKEIPKRIKSFFSKAEKKIDEFLFGKPKPKKEKIAEKPFEETKLEPQGTKYVFEKQYLIYPSEEDTKFGVIRIVKFDMSKKELTRLDFRFISDSYRPTNFITPRNWVEDLKETFQKLNITEKQAKLEGIEDQKTHIEIYKGRIRETPRGVLSKEQRILVETRVINF
jgi:hypothetical protein